MAMMPHCYSMRSIFMLGVHAIVLPGSSTKMSGAQKSRKVGNKNAYLLTNPVVAILDSYVGFSLS